MSRVLVYQANGVQGAATLNRIAEAGYVTRAMIRNRSAAARLLHRGIEVAVADLQDLSSLRRAHEGVDYVVLQVPAYGDDFVAEAMANARVALESARIKGAVIKMANPMPLRVVPNSGFSANAVVLQAMHGSTIPYSVVEPTMYLDTFLKPNLCHEIGLQHVIDLPVSESLSVAWTTIDDAARLATYLLKNQSFGRTLRCAGEIAYRGDGLAAEFSAALGRTIRYRSSVLEVFQRDIESAIGPDAARPVVAKFRFLSDYAEDANRMMSATFGCESISDGFAPTRVPDWIGANRAQFL
jgi:uncharacterized protein YbjT (DUF2867 family)